LTKPAKLSKPSVRLDVVLFGFPQGASSSERVSGVGIKRLGDQLATKRQLVVTAQRAPSRDRRRVDQAAGTPPTLEGSDRRARRRRPDLSGWGLEPGRELDDEVPGGSCDAAADHSAVA
jgi:hypothetical protein